MLLLPAGMLAPDGRCKTLDGAADGYVRAENCIVLVLQAAATSDAVSCGLLVASAVGQVGSCEQYKFFRHTVQIWQHHPLHAPCQG